MMVGKQLLKKIVRSERGLTLAELLIGVALLSVALTVGYTFYSFGYNSFTMGESRSNVRQNIRMAADFITQELRYSTHVYVLNTIPSDGSFNGDLNYIYVKDGILKHRKAGGSEETVFSIIHEGITLDQNLGFSLQEKLIYFKIKNSGSDMYSIDSETNFVNYPLVDKSGSTGMAVAYKSERAPCIAAYTVEWDNDNLVVTLTYTNNLMTDITGVAYDQFSFQNNSGTVNPNNIEKVGDNVLKLTFCNYNFKTGGNKELKYTHSAQENVRLRDMNNAYVESPNMVIIDVPRVQTSISNINNIEWINNNLEVTIEYTGNLMTVINANSDFKKQFSLQNNASFANPDIITKIGNNRLKLTFNNYDFIAGGEKELRYTRDPNAGNRLMDASDNEVKSPNTITVTVPAFVQTSISHIYDRAWNSNNLEVIVEYTGNLMSSVSSVLKTQFSLENNVSTVSPDAITKIGANRLKLTYNNYNFLTGGNKELRYTQDTNANNRLKDASNNDAKSPNTIAVFVPPYIQDFYSFIVKENVFVYGNQFAFSGEQVNGPNATMVIKGNLQGSQLNGGSLSNVSYIYIDGSVNIDGGSAGLGSSAYPGAIYINGDLVLWNGTRHIYGDVYVAGNFRLKDAHIHGNVYVNGNVELGWTPTLGTNSRIYYKGTLMHPPSGYPTSITSKCIKTQTVPQVVMPDFDIPPLKPDSWYAANGYVSGGNLSNGIKIFSTSSSYSFSSSQTFNNVIIVSKGNITLSGWITVTGVIFAPNGKVTFNGNRFEGLVIAKDGFYVTSGGSTVTFKNISHYISDVNDYPFLNITP